MKKLLLVVAILLCSSPAFSQSDCSGVIETKSYSAGEMITLKETIKVAKGNDDGIEIALLRGKALIFNVMSLGNRVKCVDDKASMWVIFADGTNIKTINKNKMNCKGDFMAIFGEPFNNLADLESLKTKKVKKISVMYSSVVNDEIKFKVEEFELEDTQSTMLMQGFKCIAK